MEKEEKFIKYLNDTGDTTKKISLHADELLVKKIDLLKKKFNTKTDAALLRAAISYTYDVFFQD